MKVTKKRIEMLKLLQITKLPNEIPGNTILRALKMLADPKAYADVVLSEENDHLIDENKKLREERGD